MKEYIEMISEISPYASVDENTLLIEEGVLDSLGIMTLIALIEERYDTVIPDDDVVAENFRSLAAIKDLIEKCNGRKEQ